MSAKDATTLVIGGEPRIDFLPPEVKAGKQARKTRRSLIALVLLVVVACAGGYVFASSLAVQAQAALAEEQARTQALLQEQGQYSEARTVAGQVATVTDARLVGTANEIMWKAYLAELDATLPGGVSIIELNVDSMSATDPVPIPSVPLQEERVATIAVTALSPDLGKIAAWLDGLRDITGFADVSGTPAQLEDGGYEVEVVLNVNSTVFEKRFSEATGADVAGSNSSENAEPEASDESMDAENAPLAESDDVSNESEG